MQIIKQANYTPDDYERLEVTAAGTTVLTAAKYLKNGRMAAAVLITCENNIVRWRDDGTPTTGAAGNGSLLLPNASMVIENRKSIENIKFIAHTGNAILHVHYYV